MPENDLESLNVSLVD